MSGSANVCSKKQSWVIARDSCLQDQISIHELTPASHSSEVYFHTADTFQSIIPVFTLLHLYICVCVMCKQVGIYVCVCAHANQRLTLRYFLDFSPLHSLRQGLSLDLELAGFTALQSATPWPPNLSVGSEGLNSDHHACTANTLSTLTTLAIFPAHNSSHFITLLSNA